MVVNSNNIYLMNSEKLIKTFNENARNLVVKLQGLLSDINIKYKI